jgi:hypothetical protein
LASCHSGQIQQVVNQQSRPPRTLANSVQ